jgi:CO/xanthine dehydrogenase FAD-binding subunit
LIEALQVLAEYASRARVAAGCSNLLPDLKARVIEDCVLVDISGLDELHGIRAEGGWAIVGSLTTIAELESSHLVREGAPILWQACQWFGDPLLRNRATVGGNLGKASPAADLAPPLLVMEAVVVAESLASGRRQFPLVEFFAGPGKTNLLPGELIAAVRFPLFQKRAGAFVKLGLRNAMAISVASAALLLEQEGGFVKEARLAFGSLAPTPFRAVRTETFLAKKNLDAGVLKQAQALAREEVQPIDDVRASAVYRRQVAGALLAKATRAALA